MAKRRRQAVQDAAEEAARKAAESGRHVLELSLAYEHEQHLGGMRASMMVAVKLKAKVARMRRRA